MSTDPTIRGIRQRLTGRQSYALLDQAMVSGSNFLTGVFLARILGVRGFGVFMLAWTAVLFLNSLQMALIVAPMMSIGSKEPEEQLPGYYGCVLACGAFFAAAAASLLLLTMLTGAWLAPQRQLLPLALPLALAAGTYLAQDLVRRYFFSIGRAGAAMMNDAVSYLGQLLLLAIFWRAVHLDCALTLWIVAATSFAAVLLGLAMLGPVTLSYGRLQQVAARHWISAKWLLGSNLIQWSAGNVFYLVAPAFLGVAAIGVLRACQSLVNVTNVWFQSMENVVPSEAARRLSSGGPNAMRQYTRAVGLRWGGSTLVFVVAVILFARPLMHFIYGSAFEGYGYAMRWMACTCLVTVLTVPPAAALRAMERTRPVLYANVVSAVLGCTLAVPLVRAFGLRGAVGGILLSRVAVLAVMEISFRVGLGSLTSGRELQAVPGADEALTTTMLE